MDIMKSIIALLPNVIVDHWRIIAAILVILVIGAVLSKILLPMISLALIIVAVVALRKAIKNAGA